MEKLTYNRLLEDIATKVVKSLSGITENNQETIDATIDDLMGIDLSDYDLADQTLTFPDKYDFANRREWGESSEKEIIQMYANARATHASAMGHGKAQMNKLRCGNLQRFMEYMGYEVPSDKECYKVGIFNGEGAV